MFVLLINQGKTTAILKFLSRDESAKPTIGLEYTFARKGANLVRLLFIINICYQMM